MSSQDDDGRLPHLGTSGTLISGLLAAAPKLANGFLISGIAVFAPTLSLKNVGVGDGASLAGTEVTGVNASTEGALDLAGMG